MKKYTVFIIALFCLFLNAQDLEITYLAVVRKTLPDEIRKEFINDGLRDQLKQNEEPDPAEYKMWISGKESSFTYVEKINNNQDQNAAVIKVAPAGFGTTYKNLSDSTQRKDFNVYGKKYFSLDKLKRQEWKITKEKKDILGFEVRKATAEDSTAVYTVWYAPKLAISNGPEIYSGLPGLILELEIRTDYGDILEVKRYTATEIEVKNKELKTPPLSKKGKRMSLKEYQEFHKEQDQRFHEMYNSAVDKD